MIHSVRVAGIILGRHLFGDSSAGLVISLDVRLSPTVFAAHGEQGHEGHQGED